MHLCGFRKSARLVRAKRGKTDEGLGADPEIDDVGLCVSCCGILIFFEGSYGADGRFLGDSGKGLLVLMDSCRVAMWWSVDGAADVNGRTFERAGDVEDHQLNG